MTNQPKNYVCFIKDNSGSISPHRKAMIADYNAMTKAFCDAASEQMLDTIVSVVALGYPRGDSVTRQVVLSNPHVLKPITDWADDGGTPLWDAIGNAIELFESLPDAQEEHVSFLILTTTDGEEQHSRKYNTASLRKKIQSLQASGRWTFVFRVPEGAAKGLSDSLGVPLDNIQQWNTRSGDGVTQSTAATKAAVSSFYASRAAGQKSSTVFYAQAKGVDTSSLKDITSDVSLYIVPENADRLEIHPFILQHRQEHLKGSSFYQLTKTEARIQPTKMLLLRSRKDGKIYAGDVRQKLGLPTDKNIRLHPGDHGDWDIFIQSESLNRLLVPKTGVVYWKAVGKPFSQEDHDRFKPKEASPAVVQLPAVAPTNKPTPSPIAPVKKPSGPTLDGKAITLYNSRSEARASGKSVKDAVENFYNTPIQWEGKLYRWFTYN